MQPGASTCQSQESACNRLSHDEGDRVNFTGEQFGHKIAVRNNMVQFALTWNHLGVENELKDV